MFDWFSKKNKRPNNIYNFPAPASYPELPPVKPAAPPKSQEHYRVGFNDDGATTLTLMADGTSMTLTMNQEACEHLIRMLRATYTDEVVEDGV